MQLLLVFHQGQVQNISFDSLTHLHSRQTILNHHFWGSMSRLWLFIIPFFSLFEYSFKHKLVLTNIFDFLDSFEEVKTWVISYCPITFVNFFFHKHCTLDVMYFGISALPASMNELSDRLKRCRIFQDSHIVWEFWFWPYSYVTYIWLRQKIHKLCNFVGKNVSSLACSVTNLRQKKLFEAMDQHNHGM